MGSAGKDQRLRASWGPRAEAVGPPHLSRLGPRLRARDRLQVCGATKFMQKNFNPKQSLSLCVAALWDPRRLQAARVRRVCR